MRLFYLTNLPYKDAKYIRATPHSQTDTRCHPERGRFMADEGPAFPCLSDASTHVRISRQFSKELRSGRATYHRRPGRCAMLRFEPESDASFQAAATSKPLERFLESRRRRAYRCAY